MAKQFKIFIINMFKLIGIMYISISLKNFLQLILGTLLNFEHDAKAYKLLNLGMRSSFESKVGLIQLMLIYDFIIFVLIAYLWIFLLLYVLVVIFGNKLWLHISYAVLVYLITILFFDHFHPNALFVLITIFLGYTNWWMFERWIKF